MDTKNFDILPEEKRNAVLNAAFTCFGKDGYKKTAMSEIAKAANVSKAALFHYFGTKKDLYFYLFRFSCDEVIANTESGTEDFFECIYISIRIKMKMMNNYPGIFNFLTSIVHEDDTELITELQAVHESDINNWITRLFADVDWNRLLPEVSMEDAINIVNWVSDGYARTYTNTQNTEAIIAGLKRYLNLIKKSIYKGEYL